MEWPYFALGGVGGGGELLHASGFLLDSRLISNYQIESQVILYMYVCIMIRDWNKLKKQDVILVGICLLLHLGTHPVFWLIILVLKDRQCTSNFGIILNCFCIISLLKNIFGMFQSNPVAPIQSWVKPRDISKQASGFWNWLNYCKRELYSQASTLTQRPSKIRRTTRPESVTCDRHATYVLQCTALVTLRAAHAKYGETRCTISSCLPL